MAIVRVSCRVELFLLAVEAGVWERSLLGKQGVWGGV